MFRCICLVILTSTIAQAGDWAVASVTEKSEDGRRYLTITLSSSEGLPRPYHMTRRMRDKHGQRFTVSIPKYDRSTPKQETLTFFMSEESLAQRENPAFHLSIEAENYPTLEVRHPLE
ncbi:MAG: hypothetical protein HOH58_11565 [Opitutaceae bacterium]|jgi:hypothetical protein|nr:hypothetical protein [Opitutaceae bacterium]